jgi:hypothetical protein
MFFKLSESLISLPKVIIITYRIVKIILVLIEADKLEIKYIGGDEDGF